MNTNKPHEAFSGVVAMVKMKPSAVDDVFNFNEDEIIGGDVLDNDITGQNGRKILNFFDGNAVGAKRGIDQVTDIAGDYGVFHVRPNGTFTYTLYEASKLGLGAGDILTEILTYKISDGSGNTDMGRMKLNISGIADLPVNPLAVDDVLVFGEYDSVAGNTLINDVPGENGVIYLQSFGGIDLAAHGAPDAAVEIDGLYGTFHVTIDGSFTYALDADVAAGLDFDEAVTETFSYTIADGNGHSGVATLALTIEGDTGGLFEL